MTTNQLNRELTSLLRDIRAAKAAPAVADMTPKQLTAALGRLRRDSARLALARRLRLEREAQ